MPHIDAAQWHDVVAAAIVDGFSEFITLTAVDDEGGLSVWLRLRRANTEDLVLSTPSASVPTVIDLLPEAMWAERETAEMFGVDFIGHETRPLLLAPGAPVAPLRKSVLLAARNTVQWPGGKEPGESGDRPPSRRRLLPPGVQP